MKLKFLSLFVALGVFALGTNLSAQGNEGAPAANEPGVWNEKGRPSAEMAPAPAEGAQAPEISPSDLITLACTWIVSNKTTLPQECSDACAKKSLAGLACCLNAAQKANKVSSALSIAAQGFCTVVCSSSSCKKSGADGLLTRTCGNICCNTTFGSVNHCLSSAAVGLTCAKFPPDCDVASLEEREEW